VVNLQARIQILVAGYGIHLYKGALNFAFVFVCSFVF